MFKLNTPYIHKDSGYLILPLLSYKSLFHNGDSDNVVVCLEGYDNTELSRHGLTRDAFDAKKLSQGNYDQVLNIYKHSQSIDYVEHGIFNSVLSLESLSINDEFFKLGKCYYNSYQGDIMWVANKVNDNFYIINYTRMIVDTAKIKIYNWFRDMPLGYNTTFMTYFNNYSGWVEVPKLYFDISTGLISSDYDILEQRLVAYRRLNIINKLLCK